MSLRCNTCGESLNIMSTTKEEIEAFSKKHFGEDQSKEHREKRAKDDEECKQMAKHLLARS